MILDEFIQLKITKPNVRFYKEKYGCKVGDLIYVSISDLSKGCSELISVKCDICGLNKKLSYRKYLKNIKNQDKYSCSSKCSDFKKKLTKLENFGYENFNNRPKSKETSYLRYGVTSPMKSDVVKMKVEETCLLKYNSKNYVSSKHFKDKMIIKYGVENPMQSEIVNTKRIKNSFRINDFLDIKYQGKYELDFLKFCQDKKISPIKPIFKIKYKHSNKDKYYIPDFFLSDFNLVIEVKSTYYYILHEEINLLKREQTILSGYEYLLILDKDYNELIQKIQL
jgi:hypothetical protein